MKAVRWILLISALMKLSLSQSVVCDVLGLPESLARDIRSFFHADGEVREKILDAREGVETFSSAVRIMESRAILWCVGAACRIRKVSRVMAFSGISAFSFLGGRVAPAGWRNACNRGYGKYPMLMRHPVGHISVSPVFPRSAG